jgi:predicted O-methyltransferase YrrM
MNKHRWDILYEIIEKNDIKIMAEIGVWKGLLLKQILRKYRNIITQYWAIDIWKPNNAHKKYAKMNEEQWNNLYLYVCRLMRFFPQVHTVQAASINASKLFPEEYFDLVFIDADHHYDPIKLDIEAWLPLVKNNGYLIGHDYGSHFEGVKKAVDECFGKDVVIEEPLWIKKVVKNEC